jgi:RNA polymerase sigma factor (sigma-70 family)
MAASPLDQFVRQLTRDAFARGEGGPTNGELLGRFVERADEAAFAALVRRHGPMVLGVCRRVLQHVHDADDAFQATFLTLVHRAAALRQRDLVANWLYGVAYRTALEARTRRARRRTKERSLVEIADPAPRPADGASELRPLLDRELSRLPAKYRMPLVLCYLEGQSRTHAARSLRIPEGTLSSRLATARKLLAARLGRRGLTICGAALAVALAEGAAPVAVPSDLSHATVRVAAGLAAGRVVLAGAVSAAVVTLTRKGLVAMSRKKVTIATTLVFAVALSGALAIWLAGTVRAGARDEAPAALKAKPTRIVVAATIRDAGKLEALLLSVDPETGGTKKLAELSAGHPRVSPDRRTVVFWHDNAVWNCDTGGGNNPGKLFDWSYESSVWSPDGKYLFVSKVTSLLSEHLWSNETWRYDAGGRNPVKVNLPVSEAVLDISPDGRLFLTRSRLVVGLNTSELMAIKAGGTDARRLSPPGGVNEPGRFSPDGRRVAWIRNGGELWVVGVDGKEPKKIFDEGGTHLRQLAWSPDGKRFAVVAATYGPGPDGQLNALGGPSGDNHWRVEILDVDGENRRELKIADQVRWVGEVDWHALPE